MRVLWSQFILKTLKKHVWNCLTIQNNWRLSIHKLSRLSRKLSGPSEKYQYYSETFQAIQKLNRPSGKYPDYTETFQAIQKLSRLSRNFSRYPEIFQIIRKISSLSGNFPGYPEIFRIIRKISSLSGNYLKGPETSQCNFKGYAQKLSGRAKTFRVAMPPCHPGFCASAWANAGLAIFSSLHRRIGHTATIE